MQTADFNHNDFSNTAEADKSLMVKFFFKNVQNKMESQKQGRPIYKEKTYIEIRIAGQRDAQACRPVTHQDKLRFPAHFKAFEERTEAPAEGMPLQEWTGISRSQAEELAFLHIKTVEQLAGVKDGNIQNFMGGYALREKAQKWLATANAEAEDTEKEELRADLSRLASQVKGMQETESAEKDDLRREVNELRASNEELLARLNAPSENASPELASELDEEAPAAPKPKSAAKPRKPRNAN